MLLLQLASESWKVGLEPGGLIGREELWIHLGLPGGAELPIALRATLTTPPGWGLARVYLAPSRSTPSDTHGPISLQVQHPHSNDLPLVMKQNGGGGEA